MYTRGRLGEHGISVGNHDAKLSGFQLIESSLGLESSSKDMVLSAKVERRASLSETLMMTKKSARMANQSARTI